MKYLLFNPRANSGHGKDAVDAFVSTLEKDVQFEEKDLIGLDVKKLFAELKPEDEVIIFGGDGTLNHFVNDVADIEIKNKVFLHPSGTGNDFLNDRQSQGKMIQINEYIHDLPVVEVNGMTRRFINGIGYGIEGYCCEVADKQIAKGVKKVNYTGIAIKGLLFFYKRAKATVIIDGEEHHFKSVWMAPTMKGSFFGGGMNVTPQQDRSNPEKTLTTVIFTGKSKLHTLMVFPSIFKGKMGEHKKMYHSFTVKKEVEIKFEKPCALQIDGETVLNVLSYKVKI